MGDFLGGPVTALFRPYGGLRPGSYVAEEFQQP